jgi:hypothetical protein
MAMPEAPPERSPIATAPLSAIFYFPADVDDVLPVLEAWLEQLTARPAEFELLLIVPAHRTDIVEAAESLRARDRRVHVIRHLAAPGVGPELQTGLWLARHPLVLVAPGDRQFQATDLGRLLESIDQVDLVAGYRVHGGVPWWLRGLNLLGRLLRRVLLGDFGEARGQWLGWSGLGRRLRYRRLLGLQVRDAECPLRLYRRGIFARIPIQSRGSFAHVEILAKANHLGCWISEAPVTWTPPEHAAAADADFAADWKAVFRDPDFGPARGPQDIRAGEPRQ